ncbi:hypothetical protein GE21DRAFT_1221286, partial [Neurospora crassa]
VFDLFILKNIAFSLKKLYITYLNIELLGFKVDTLGLSITDERIIVFRNLEFPNTLKSLEKYISVLGFIQYFIPYYTKIVELL